MHHWLDYARIITAVFVITNPLGAVPLFVSLTSEQSEADKRRTARLTAVTVAAVLCSAIFVGEPLLNLFGIGIPSFRVGGGILILIMAIAMMHAHQGRTRHTPEEDEEAADKENIAVVPLGIPLLAGPGAISTVIIYAHRAAGAGDTLFLVGACLLVAAVIWAALRLAEPLAALLGRTGINIATRLMGLVLAAIAVEFIAGGLAVLLPGLAGH